MNHALEPPLSAATIAFIGGGNMAHSLIGGLISDGFAPNRIWVADPDAETRARLAARFQVNTSATNAQASGNAHVVLLATKPQVLRQAAADLVVQVKTRRPLIISIAAGVRVDDIDRWLGGEQAIVRCMPNTPALVASGATALFANARVSEARRELAESIMRAVGGTHWIEEETGLDAVTALSGSGPAYVFLMMEAMQAAGEQLGLRSDVARLLTLETVFGAAKMALESEESAATLRARVTSKGGTTERALAILEQGHLRELFNEALTSARDRAIELGDLMGEEV